MLSLPVSNILHKVGYSNIYTAVIRLGRSVFDPLKTFAASFDPYDLFTVDTNGLWLDPSDVNMTWRRNLLTYSEQFDNVVWGVVNASIVANVVVAPDGTLSADKLVENAVTAQHYIQVPDGSTAADTFSISVKAAERSWLFIGFVTGSAYYDLNTGQLGTVTTGVAASISPQGNGWYRCSISQNSPDSGTVRIYVVTENGVSNYTGDGTSGIYIWGAQLELGSTATAYQRITDGIQDYLQYQPLPVLYQDAAGTLPVTAVEQPVGLWLDKSKGLVLGPELVTNGDFSGPNLSQWTAYLGGTFQIENGLLKCISSGSGTACYATIPTVPEKWYKVEFDAKIGTDTSFGVDLSTSFLGSVYKGWAAITDVNLTKRTAFILASSPTLIIRAYNLTSGTYAYLDNISVRELPGNHTFNPSGNSANFPVLSARTNLLTKTEDLVNTVWSKDSANTVPTSLGNGETRIQFLSGGTGHRINHLVIVNVPANTSITLSCKIKSSDADNVGKEVILRSQNSAPTDIIGQTITLTSTYQTVKLSGVIVDTRGNLDFRFVDFGLTNPVTDFTVKELQLVFTNDALNKPDYQRVNTATDYDTVGFPKYLKFNGVNQWLQTNSIDFSYGDKMFVSAGVRKLSDAARGIVVELGVVANSGTININAPAGASPSYSTESKGTSYGIASITTYVSPILNVISGIGDISGDRAILRVNGAQVSQAITDQGNGNYGNYPLYIGARGGSSLWFNGNLHQLVIAGKQVSAAEITATETFINQKTGAY